MHKRRASQLAKHLVLTNRVKMIASRLAQHLDKHLVIANRVKMITSRLAQHLVIDGKGGPWRLKGALDFKSSPTQSAVRGWPSYLSLHPFY